jgi:hypothetical protein
MIKASELRIGNYVMTDGWHPDLVAKGIEITPFPEQVTEIYFEDKNGEDTYLIRTESNCCFEGETAIEPIPLTEEWLLKFGFRPLDNKNWHLGKIKVWSGATGIYFQFNTPDDIDDVEIKYVHQIQNLYFAFY